MSTQSPTPLTPKGPRNARRNQKRTTPSAQNTSTLATPPSSPPRASSPREAVTDSSGTIAFSSKKKGNRSAKKPRDVPKTSPVNKPGHRHTSSQSNNTVTTPHMKDTHYAGPTFHASPAPSALPIPSFFSKSFPESDLAPMEEHDSDSFEADEDIENTPSKPKSRPVASQDERESTPLDFLFKAAVQARTSQTQQSPERSPQTRPQTDSKAFPYRKFNNDTNGLFPLEMGPSDLHQSQIGPSFAPSYKDRMNALRSASSPSPTLQDLDEDQRKAKTEALKTLLLNPRPQRPSSNSPSHYDHINHKPERPTPNPMLPHFATPMRTSSGPPTMSNNGELFGKVLPSSEFSSRPVSHQAQYNSPQRHKLQDPTLGGRVLAANPGNTPTTPRQPYGSPSRAYPPAKVPAQQTSTRYSQYPQYNSHSPVYQSSPASSNSPALDTKRMEDDLRRILKLDANPSIPSGGMQSSLA